jgi:hypothetical protein
MKHSQSRDCWSEWCCPSRSRWYQTFCVALILSAAFAALIVGTLAYTRASFDDTQRVYTVNDRMSTYPAHHVLTSSVILNLGLPNNMVEFVGGLYTVNCGTHLAHTITIDAGPLPTTWDSTNRVATCTDMVKSSILFRVVSPSEVQVLASPGITFS